MFQDRLALKLSKTCIVNQRISVPKLKQKQWVPVIINEELTRICRLIMCTLYTITREDEIKNLELRRASRTFFVSSSFAESPVQWNAVPMLQL